MNPIRWILYFVIGAVPVYLTLFKYPKNINEKLTDVEGWIFTVSWLLASIFWILLSALILPRKK